MNICMEYNNIGIFCYEFKMELLLLLIIKW